MPAYTVIRPDLTGATAVSGHNAVVVFAADATDAKAMAKALHPGDSGALWDAATVTELVAATDMTGWRARCTVSNVSTGAVVADVTVTAAASDVIDDMGTDLATALNATASIAGAGYVIATQVLTVAETTDTLGDHAVTLEFFPPTSYALGQDVAVPSFVASITDEGAGGAALSATLVADASVVPNVPVGVSS